MKAPTPDPANTTISEARDTLGALLRRPYERLQDRVYGGLAAKGFEDIRPAHSNVFRYILPQGSRVSDLAERAQMTKQSMAYLTDSLEQAGYVTIGPDPADGRAKLVILTVRGNAVWEALIDLSREIERECIAAVGQKAFDSLRQSLRIIETVISSDRTSSR